MSAGSGSRPGPESGPVSRPTAGGRTTAPRRRRVATLSWVAGCSHISVCIAGTKTTGQDAVSRVAVSRSSARPMAARASRSAVAGATTTRSAFWPMRTWATSGTSDQTSVVTGLPDSASKVAAPTKCRAPGGRDDADVVAGLGERAQHEGGLVGGHSPAHAQHDRTHALHPPQHDDAPGSGCRVRSSSIWVPAVAGRPAQFSPAVWVSRPSLISRSAIERGFSCGAVSTSGPTYSSRPSESWL